MKLPPAPHLCLAAALATALLALTAPGCGVFGGPSDPLDDLRDYIGDHVDDKDRATDMLVLVDQIDANLTRFAGEARQRSDALRRAHADYDTSRAELHQQFARSNAARTEVRRNLIRALLEIRELATVDEWRRIADYQERVFRARYSVGMAVGGEDR